MNIQLKKGLLEYCVLAVLNRGDSYGYRIIGDISPAISISESTLYPILKRLEADEMLVTYSVEASGRLRKYYRITSAGRAKLTQFPQEWEEMKQVSQFVLDDLVGKDDPHG